MPITDTPAPFAEAYARLQDAQRRNGLVTPEERAERDKIIEHASERRRVKRRMWKPF
jgi:hypothetical protein